jgi:hypothetical protein
MNALNEKGFSYLKENDRAFMTIFLLAVYSIFSIINNSIPEFLVFCQILLLFINTLSIFYLSLALTENLHLASISAIINSFTVTVLRFQPLFSGLFSLSLLFFSISYILYYNRNGRKKDLIIGSIFATLSIFTNIWYFIYFSFLFIISLVISLLINFKQRVVIEYQKYLPFILLLMIFSILFSISLSEYEWLIPDIIRNVNNILNRLHNPQWMLNDIHRLFGTLIEILGIASSLLIPYYIKDKFAQIFLISWISLSFLISIFGLIAAYHRVYMLIPFSLLSSFFVLSLYRITKIRYKGSQYKIRFNIVFEKRKIKILNLKRIIFLIILIFFSVSLFQSFYWQQKWLGPHISKEDYQNIIWLRRNFNNHSIICFSTTNGNAYTWSKSILISEKREVYQYYGDIVHLLGGQINVTDWPYMTNQKLIEKDIFNNLEKFTIILPELTYEIGDIEKNYLHKIPERDIYYLSLSSSEEKEKYYNLLSR